MASRFWRRYRPSGAGFSSGSGGGGAGSRGNTPLLQDLADRAAYFVKAVAAIYIVRENLVEFTVCVGPSMMPTFNPKGDVALLEHVSVWSGRVKVGDVVLSRSMQNPRHMVCKRVLGLEGDIVYVPSSTRLGLGKTVMVPPGHVWLQGDNFHNSTDSRHYGPVPYALLRGRVFLKVWPPWEAGRVQNKLPPWQQEERERQQREEAKEQQWRQTDTRR